MTIFHYGIEQVETLMRGRTLFPAKGKMEETYSHGKGIGNGIGDNLKPLTYVCYFSSCMRMFYEMLCG